MSKGVEPIRVTRQKIVGLPRTKLTMAEVYLRLSEKGKVYPNIINRMETLLEESQGIGAEEFIV
jgi:hypothetical protein